MEIELKYLLSGRAQADEILNDGMVAEVMEEGSLKSVDMDAVYFDTEDYRLTKEGIALRVRLEGDSYVATVKDKGHSIKGMHKREEINVRLDDEEMIKHPDVSIFRESEAYRRLLNVAGPGKLEPVLEMRFERRVVRIDTGSSISELSFDDGEMIAGGKKLPIMEMEMELYSGSEQDMESFGRKLAEKYSLSPEDRSKFERAYSLLDA